LNLPTVTWSALLLVYLVFASWYTSCSEPLDEAEIAGYLGRLESQGRPAEDLAAVRAFLESDTGDDFVMVNVIELREPPALIEGVAPGDDARSVLDRYMQYMFPALFRRACHPVMIGTAAAQALDLWGIEGAERWSMAGLMRYRSRRDLMDIATNPDFQGPHEFKIAAMTKTIAFPIDPWWQLGDPRLVLALGLLVAGLVVHGFEGHRRARRRAGATEAAPTRSG
jgi:preprotein translocase subunit Sec61beta